MQPLRDLLATWENWSARNTLARALGRVSNGQTRDALTRSLADMPDVDPLDAVRDAAELVALLQGWRWQAVHAARRTGATWAEIATTTGITEEQARENYATSIAIQERHGVSDVSVYREVL